jgi:hypothetical protein
MVTKQQRDSNKLARQKRDCKVERRRQDDNKTARKKRGSKTARQPRDSNEAEPWDGKTQHQSIKQQNRRKSFQRYP